MHAMPRAIGPAKIRPLRRERRQDAEDMADELIGKILLHRERFALFVLPNDECRYTPERAIRFQDWCERWPQSLCGIYDSDVSRSALIADILAMQR